MAANPTEVALAAHIETATGVTALAGARAFPLGSAMPTCVVLCTLDRSGLRFNAGGLRVNEPGKPSIYTAWYLAARHTPGNGGVTDELIAAREAFRASLKASFTGLASFCLGGAVLKAGVPLEFRAHSDGIYITFMGTGYIGWEVAIGVEENFIGPA